MSFAELLDRIGGMGRFQLLHIALLVVPVLMTACHNLLQNFSAAVPGHHCRLRLAPNETRHLSPGDLLRVSVPLDAERQPEKCRRFISPQWHLLRANGTGANGTEGATEACVDGWTYDRSTFTNTIIIEVRRGHLLGGLQCLEVHWIANRSFMDSSYCPEPIVSPGGYASIASAQSSRLHCIVWALCPYSIAWSITYPLYGLGVMPPAQQLGTLCMAQSLCIHCMAQALQLKLADLQAAGGGSGREHNRVQTQMGPVHGCSPSH